MESSILLSIAVAMSCGFLAVTFLLLLLRVGVLEEDVKELREQIASGDWRLRCPSR